MGTFKSALLILLTVTTLTMSKPSRAAVGGALWNPTIALSGLAILGGGTIVTLMASNLDELGTGILAGLIGIVVLDAEEGQMVTFKALDKATALKLKVSESERRVFNDELDQANALLTEVIAEMSKLELTSQADASHAWASLKGFVSQETFDVMKKIATN